jgi:hypothetical protein
MRPGQLEAGVDENVFNAMPAIAAAWVLATECPCMHAASSGTSTASVTATTATVPVFTYTMQYASGDACHICLGLQPFRLDQSLTTDTDPRSSPWHGK